MANHCIEVICGGCGRIYCMRGCGTDFKKDKEYLEKWLNSVKEKDRFVMAKNDCCSGFPVYSWSCGDIKTT